MRLSYIIGLPQIYFLTKLFRSLLLLFQTQANNYFHVQDGRMGEAVTRKQECSLRNKLTNQVHNKIFLFLIDITWDFLSSLAQLLVKKEIGTSGCHWKESSLNLPLPPLPTWYLGQFASCFDCHQEKSKNFGSSKLRKC